MPAPLRLKVEDSTRARLARVALALERSPHWVLEQALEEYLSRDERRLDEAADDAARWERFLLTGEASDGSDVNAWLARLATTGPIPWRSCDDVPRPPSGWQPHA
jgi:predicted transcriptional regulator